MKILILPLLLLGFASAAVAQMVMGGNEKAPELYMVDRAYNEEGQATGLRYIPWNEYFGEDAAVMQVALEVARERKPLDEFQWHKKIPGIIDWENSCSDAAQRFIQQIESEQALPEGWKVRQIGTLGSLTSAENYIGERWDQVRRSWRNKWPQAAEDWNTLDPPSYAHSLTVIKSPDGNYYSIDNWQGMDVKIKRIYPIDPDATFFSTDPDEENAQNAEYRRSRVDLRPWDFEEKLKERDKEKEGDEPSPIPPTSEPAPTEILTSADPNDKIGTRGAGPQQYITPDGRLHYLIRFENLATASAPAQEVLVRDTLDADVMDLSTFTLGDITFGSRRVSVPPGRSGFTTRLPLAEGRLELLVTAHLVPETGIVTWRFTTLDPATQDLPLDPLDGFLPPNRNAPEGEGSVAFSIRMREGLAHDTRVRNEARIVFDLNEPIDTPPWINTLDLVPPASSVTALEPVQSDTVIALRWDGSDQGSGIRSYDIYVSTNSGPFRLWQMNTPAEEAVFGAQPDSTYAFFSIAYDAMGHAEPMKTQADAATVVLVSTEPEGGGSELPTAFGLQQNYPNPFNPETVIRYDVKEHAHVTLAVYDLTGRAVSVLVDGPQAPGRHSVTMDASRLPSGVYFYRIRMGDFEDVKKMVLVR